jgi:recombination protein RecT
MSNNHTPTTTTEQESPSVRFQAAIMREFSNNPMKLSLTGFQQKLIQNYFIKIDQSLKAAELKRMAKSEQYREALSYTWANVNMIKLSVDIVAYSSVGLDPLQKNHINIIPYKNSGSNKYDLTFIIGYSGIELKAKKYGLDVPDDIICEVVFSTDTFKPLKKDLNNHVESYIFEINNSFERGEIVGGFWYAVYKSNPEKNKLRIFNKQDIEKRKPKHASAEFWGGEKDVYKNNQKVGKEIIDGWYFEMVLKTLKRNSWDSIVIDSEKIDDHLVQITSNDYNNKQIESDLEVIEKANKTDLDFEDATVINPLQITEKEPALANNIEFTNQGATVAKEVEPPVANQSTQQPSF